MLDIGSTELYEAPLTPFSSTQLNLPISWVYASQNDTVQPSGLLSNTQLYEPGSSPTWQSIPNATFNSGYAAGFTATGIIGTDSLTVGRLPPVRQYVGVMWYTQPVMDTQQIQGILGLGLSSGGTSGSGLALIYA